MWRILEYETVASTNLTARELIALGSAHHGDVIQASHQTAGRGRLASRMWADESGRSLLMSIVLERLPVPRVELVQYLLALAVADALRALLAAQNVASQITIKWPNDLLLNGRKVCGILSEGTWQGDYLRGLVAGIGINVFRQCETPETAHATSLEEVLERVTPIHEVRDAVLKQIQQDLERYEALPSHVVQMSIIGDFRTELLWMKALPQFRATLADGTQLNSVVYDGVTDTGALSVKEMSGSVHVIRAGFLDIPKETIENLLRK